MAVLERACRELGATAIAGVSETHGGAVPWLLGAATSAGERHGIPIPSKPL